MNATQVEPTQSELGSIVEPVDQFFCPQCKAKLDSACVVGKTITDEQTHRSYREIRIFCDHCDKGFVCNCGYSGGMLKPMEAPHEIASAADRKKLLAIIDHRRFVIQRQGKKTA